MVPEAGIEPARPKVEGFSCHCGFRRLRRALAGLPAVCGLEHAFTMAFGARYRALRRQAAAQGGLAAAAGPVRALSGDRCPPSALYTFPKGSAAAPPHTGRQGGRCSGAASLRAWLGVGAKAGAPQRCRAIRAFAEFDGFHPAGFPTGAQIFKSLVSTSFTTRAVTGSNYTISGACLGLICPCLKGRPVRTTPSRTTPSRMDPAGSVWSAPP